MLLVEIARSAGRDVRCPSLLLGLARPLHHRRRERERSAPRPPLRDHSVASISLTGREQGRLALGPGVEGRRASFDLVDEPGQRHLVGRVADRPLTVRGHLGDRLKLGRLSAEAEQEREKIGLGIDAESGAQSQCERRPLENPNLTELLRSSAIRIIVLDQRLPTPVATVDGVPRKGAEPSADPGGKP